MHISLQLLTLIPISTTVLADFLGPRYPSPRDLSSSESRVPAAWKNVSSVLTAYLSEGESSTSSSDAVADLKNVTFSLGMFSLYDPSATNLQYHYTSPEIVNAPNGTNRVDSDSIYRIASVTKLFTVFAGLLELNATEWERPLTDTFPTLRDYARKNPGETDPIYNVEWDKVTPSALAAQIAGVPRDGYPGPAEILLLALIAEATGGSPSEVDPTAIGMPTLSQNDPLAYPPCTRIPETLEGACPTIPWLQSLENRAPSFQPWTTPAYSDNGFALLGLAISAMIGKSLDQVYRESIFEPLNMTRSNSSTPPQSMWENAVIPGNASTSFDIEGGVYTSSGALLSTTHDLAKLGVGILNSTLLPPDKTREWLKPVSHTARLQYSVGRPWEIMRYTHTNGVVTDIYTKSGDSGDYSSWLVILPDYDAGFSILASSSTVTSRFDVVALIADLITDTVIHALAAQAEVEAERNYGGSYSSTVPGLNSSLTLCINKTEEAAPGLTISEWISNGTDVLTDFIYLSKSPFRIVPSIPEQGTGQIAFRLLTAVDAPDVKVLTGGLFTGFTTSDWISVDSLTYGDVAVGFFVFDVGKGGKAKAVSPAAFRTKLERRA